MKKTFVAILLLAALTIGLCSCQQKVSPASSNVTTQMVNEKGLDLNETPLMI